MEKQALEELPQIFSNHPAQARKDGEEPTASLYQQIGQLQVELDWMKKPTPVKLTRKAQATGGIPKPNTGHSRNRLASRDGLKAVRPLNFKSLCPLISETRVELKS